MEITDTPGPCPRCQSTNTKRYTIKGPKVGKAHRCAPECDKPCKSSKTRSAHRCTPKCEETERLCLNCRTVTPFMEH